MPGIGHNSLSPTSRVVIRIIFFQNGDGLSDAYDCGDNDEDYLNDDEDDFYNSGVVINHSLTHLSMRCHMLVQLLSVLQ